MKRLIIGGLLVAGALGFAWAQQFSMPPPAGVQVMGCIYNLVQPTITTGNPGFVQCDANGNIAAGGGGGSLSAKATAAAPTYVEGSTDPLSMDLSGNTRVIATGLAQGSTTSGQTGSLIMGAVTTAPPSYTTAQTSPVSLDASGGLRVGSQYPAGATPITASATGTTAATTATLATGASVTTYICGFSIRANATAAATANATVTGTITGTLNFTQWTAPLASGIGLTEMVFSPCVPASAVNTGIAVVSAAPGSGGVVSSTAWGYTRAAQ